VLNQFTVRSLYLVGHYFIWTLLVGNKISLNVSKYKIIMNL